MIAVAQKTYSLLYRGRRERISAVALAKLNDSMGARYADASPEMQRKLIATLLELNYNYFKRPPAQFYDPMDEDDWFQTFKLMLPRVLMAYDPLMGHLHTHIISWKKAALSKWLNTHQTIHVPQNQRDKCRDIERRISKKDKRPVSEHEQRFYESARIKTHSLNYKLGPDGEEVQDLIVGEDPRDTAGGHTERDLWKKIEETLSPKEFQIWKWKHHPDYELTHGDIGLRLGVSGSRIEQIAKVARNKLRVKLAAYLEIKLKDAP